jgi:hypothetical protein
MQIINYLLRDGLAITPCTSEDNVTIAMLQNIAHGDHTKDV